jgi:hypothetical protein
MSEVSTLNLSAPAQVFGVDAFAESSTQKHQLGTNGWDANGRRFRYALIGASNAAAGHLLQTSARSTDFTDMTPSAATAIGDTSINVTLGSTATTANLFTGGYLITTAGTGLGYTYPIAGHTVAAGAAVATFNLGTAIKIATNASTSRVTTVRNPYAGVVDSPTTATGITVGVASFVQTAAYYSWIGVQGYFGVLASTTVAAIGGGVQAKNSSTAGSANILAAAGYQIGGAPILGVDAEYQIVHLNLP